MNLNDLKKLGYKFNITCKDWSVYYYTLKMSGSNTKQPVLLGATHVLIAEGKSEFESDDIRVRNKVRARHNREAARQAAHIHFVKIRML